MKALVTGDRDWSDVKLIVDTLEQLPPGTIVVHGACRGADTIAGEVAKALGFVVRAYPADWDSFKFRAGPIRNQLMLDEEHREEEPIDLVIAFHDDIGHSKGTKDMVKKALKAGILKENVKLVKHPNSSEESERVSAKDEAVGSIPTLGTTER